MNHIAVCVSVFPPINMRMPQPIFMKFGMYTMAPEPISTAHFTQPSRQYEMCVPLSRY
jgi:hypothetical protein